VDGIGEPLNVFYYTLYLAIPVNAGLIVYTYKALKFVHWLSDTYAFAGCMVLGFVVLMYVEEVYPEVTVKTRMQLERSAVVFDRVVQEHQEKDASTLHLNESLIGVTLAEVKARNAAAAAKNRPVMRQRKVPAGFVAPVLKRLPVDKTGVGMSMGDGGGGRALGSGLGGPGYKGTRPDGAGRHPELEGKVAAAVKALSAAVADSVDLASEHLAAAGRRGDKAANDAARLAAAEVDAAASEHAAFFSLAAEAARAEARRAGGLAGSRGGKGVKLRMAALEAEVSRAVGALAKATAEAGNTAKERAADAEKEGDWVSVERAVTDLLAAEAAAAEQAGFYSLAAATAEAEQATTAQAEAHRRARSEHRRGGNADAEYASELTGTSGEEHEDDAARRAKKERKRARRERRHAEEAAQAASGNPLAAPPKRGGGGRNSRAVELTSGAVPYERAFHREPVSEV